ncbi:MAG: DUF4097 domain-containing protein, partial [Deinococcota bacterium]|nr:DUF4097 domain-containing protein [Deinococcota bacterium]
MIANLFGVILRDTLEVELEPVSPLTLCVMTGSGSIRVDHKVEHKGDGVFQVTARVTVRASTEEQARTVMDTIRQDPPVARRQEEVVVGDLQKYGLSSLRGVSVTVDFEIEAPYDTALNLRSGSGGQRVRALRGPVRAAAGSGAIVIEAVAQEVEATSGSGAITVRGARSAEARAGSGSLTLQNIEGHVNARTGSGRIELESSGGDLRADSGSGSIRVASALPQGAAWRLRAASGSIEVSLPEGSSFALTAKTASGRVSV